MERNNVAPEDVIFIAHGTTQATNALLEGDVVKVGVIGIGSGVEGAKTKLDTKMGEIPLTSSKSLNTANQFVDPTSASFKEDVAAAIKTLVEEDCKSIVVAEAFSVDHAENVDYVMGNVRYFCEYFPEKPDHRLQQGHYPLGRNQWPGMGSGQKYHLGT